MEYIRDRVDEDKSSRIDLIARMMKALAYCNDPWRLRARKFKENDPEIRREYTPIEISGLPQGVQLLTSGSAT